MNPERPDEPRLQTGQPAPDFSLPGIDEQVYTLSAQRGKIVVVNFWSAECPWSERADQELSDLARSWGEAAVLLTIACNANETREQIAQAAAERGLTHVLLDPQQQTAGLYGAVTTPHIFVVDAQGLLRYQGALNDLTFRQRQATRQYAGEAVQALLAGRLPNPSQTPPYGCTIVRFS